TTSKFLVEGTDLHGASAVVFSEPGLSGTILEVNPVPEFRLAFETKTTVIAKPYFQDPPPVQAILEVAAEKWTAVGTHRFRIITPHGSSTVGKLVVGAFPELEEQEPNDTTAQAQLVPLPITIHGTILKAGDVDQYRFESAVGKEIVVQVE